MSKKRILILMSDTGGGHRAAAEAIIEAMNIRYKDQVEITMVDGFREAGFPFKYAPEVYPLLINYTRGQWGVGYKFLNTQKRAQLATRGIYITAESGLKKMLRKYPADVVVSVHSVLTGISMQALLRADNRPPYLVVVTDLATTHMFWYDRRVERTLVPTQAAYDNAIEAGLDPDKVRITGLPVNPKFSEKITDRDAVRSNMGWDPELPTFLLVGGGEGMGPLYKTARAINDRNLKCQLVIIAGRNKTLKDKLETSKWNQPTHVYGFITDMPRLMAASDILVSKAGPATIMEACIAHLPIILYDAIPGQEQGNVDLVVNHDVGVYAPSPELVADTAQAWLKEGKEGLQRRSENAAHLARPNAVWDIADEIWEQTKTPPVVKAQRKFFGQISPKFQMPRIPLINDK